MLNGKVGETGLGNLTAESAIWRKCGVERRFVLRTESAAVAVREVVRVPDPQGDKAKLRFAVQRSLRDHDARFDVAEIFFLN